MIKIKRNACALNDISLMALNLKICEADNHVAINWKGKYIS